MSEKPGSPDKRVTDYISRYEALVRQWYEKYDTELAGKTDADKEKAAEDHFKSYRDDLEKEAPDIRGEVEMREGWTDNEIAQEPEMDKMEREMRDRNENS